MPTPFTHLEMAARLVIDPAVPETARKLIRDEYSAFLPGIICADARPENGADREVTHFYRYDKPITDHPWRVMLEKYPMLKQPATPAHRVFVGGYVAHLAADEYWSRYMLSPHFAEGNWGSDMRWRFFVLHLLLIYMDERDLKTLTADTARTLRGALPNNWLPFMPDHVVCEWRDFVADQITGESKTLEVLGARIKKTPEELREVLDSSETMQACLWDNITPPLLAQIEADMYVFSREQLLLYLNETAGLFK